MLKLQLILLRKFDPSFQTRHFRMASEILPCSSESASFTSFTSDIVKEVEEYLSDVNLATTDNLARSIIDNEFVPISTLASLERIQVLVSSLIGKALKSSSKIVVSEDGKTVKRRQPFNETDIEELQSRIVVVENLPADQNLMHIFSAVGSVKTVRTSTAASGNMLSAYVEYESAEFASKAVTELNDGSNRFKVRPLCSPTVVENIEAISNIEPDDDIAAGENLVVAFVEKYYSSLQISTGTQETAYQYYRILKDTGFDKLKLRESELLRILIYVAGIRNEEPHCRISSFHSH